MKTFLLLFGIGILLVTLFVRFFVLDLNTEPPEHYTTFEPGTYTEPGPDTDAGTQSVPVALTLHDGGEVVVRDFIHNGITAADVVNPGHYYLAGSIGYCLADGSCPTGASTTKFTLTYSEQYDFFNLVLLEEPIAEARKEGEALLLSMTGLSEEQACRLKYSVGTPYWINLFYAGKELGFSFCPGNVPLE